MFPPGPVGYYLQYQHVRVMHIIYKTGDTHSATDPPGLYNMLIANIQIHPKEEWEKEG